MRQATRFCGTVRTRDGRSSGGQSVVELALMLPVLVVLVSGILDLGRIYYSYIAVVNVAREAVRYAAANPPRPSCAQGLDVAKLTAIEARARNEATGSKLNPAQLTVLVECGDPSAFETPIRVSVWYDFRPILSQMLLNGVLVGPIRIHSQAEMQIFAQ